MSFIKLATAFYLKMPWQRAVPQTSSLLAKIAFISYSLDHNHISVLSSNLKISFKKTDLSISSSHPTSQVCELTLMFNKIIYANKRELKTNKHKITSSDTIAKEQTRSSPSIPLKPFIKLLERKNKVQLHYKQNNKEKNVEYKGRNTHRQ